MTTAEAFFLAGEAVLPSSLLRRGEASLPLSDACWRHVGGMLVACWRPTK
ncbi:MAG: hypothetical protein WC483_00635 [Candidatus Paceibacterota bacterium]